jgi:hypothetical protein
MLLRVPQPQAIFAHDDSASANRCKRCRADLG